MRTAVAREPFETWPIQFHDPELGLFAWYARPATYVTQTTATRATGAHATLIGRAMDHLLDRYRSEVEMHAGLLVIHDWRSLRELEPEARRIYSQRIEGYKRGFQRGAYVALDLNPALRTVVRLAATALPFRVGYTVEVLDDPLVLLGRHGLVPVLSTNPFEGLPRF